MKNITGFAVKNWQFTTIIFIMAVALGVKSLFTMPRGEDPEFSAPTFPVIIVYPGTTPSDMEKLVVKPIEERFYALDNINRIQTKIDDGLAVINVKYNYDSDPDEKYQELIRELDALKKDLPEDIAYMEIKKISPSDVNILQIALISESMAYSEMYDYADKLKSELEQIKSLKNVDIWGYPEKTVRVSLDLKRMSKMGINPMQVVNKLQSENMNIPASSINMGSRKFNVRTSGNYKDIEEIAYTVIRSANSRVIYLKDIADVDFAYDEYKHICRLNGNRSVIVTASLKTNENITKVSEHYRKVIEDFSEKMPENIYLVNNFDQSLNVSSRLNRLGIDFMIAIILVSVTLLPIGRRSSYVVMLSIPLSLSIGLALLSIFGFTLNQLSIVGLVVSLGLVIDDSIIVIENIERWRRSGYSKIEAAIKATGQISMAVVGCTLLLMLAFMPIAFMPEESGAFIRSLPMAIIFTVLASLVVSLTIVPFLSTLILKEDRNVRENIFLVFLNKAIHVTYSKLLGTALNNPAKTLIIAVIIFASALALFPVIGFTLFPKSEKPQFLINVESEQGSNIEETDRIAGEIEKILAQKDIVDYYTCNVGKGNPRIYYNEMQRNESPNFAQFFVQLNPDTRPKEKNQFIDELRSTFDNFQFSRIEVKDFEQGPPLEAPIAVRIFCEDLDTLRTTAMQIEELLKSKEGIIYVNNPLKTTKTDIRVRINKEKAAIYGISTIDIDRSVRLALAGINVGTFTDSKDNDYIINVTMPKGRSADYSVLNDVYVSNAAGAAVPIRTIADFGFDTSPTEINRYNKSRFTTVTAHLKRGYLASKVNARLETIMKEQPLPRNCTYTLAGEKENTSNSFSGFGTIVIIAIFGFLSILILEFKTFKSLIIVLSVIPLGIIGAVYMLLLSGQPFSFVAIIGLIALVGIEIKNSILLVDFTNQLRANGVALNKAIIQAGEIRFVPIILTAITTICGLIPLVIEFSPLYSPLALVIIGGLLTSTLLSRIVTPVMYKLLPPKVELIDNPNK